MVSSSRASRCFVGTGLLLAGIVLLSGGLEGTPSKGTFGTSIIGPVVPPGILIPPLIAGPPGSDGQTGGGDGDGGEPTTIGAAEPCEAPCTNTGIEWVDPYTDEQGNLRCRRTRIGLQFGGFGIGWSFGSTECPLFSIHTPGHWGRVNKNCFDAVDPAQVMGERQNYRCAHSPTPGVTTIDCAPDGSLTPYLTHAVNFDEAPCLGGGSVATP